MSDLSFREAYEGGYNHGPLKRVEIREGMGTHQIAILDYLIPASNFTDLAPEGTPMAFRWSVTPTDVRTFYGYVNHHEYVDTNETQGMYLRFFCLGASMPMNDPSTGSWTKVTASYIARQVAERHNLRALVSNSQELLPFWTSGIHGDFEMMTRLAEEVGYNFWVDGATLYFLDPQILLTSPKRGLTAEYRLDRVLNQDTLLQVQSITGSRAPRSSAPVVQTAYGINDDGRLIQATSTQAVNDLGLPTPGTRRILPRSVQSLAEAARRNEQAVVNGTWTSIQAITSGDARARVGSLVDLEGNALNETYRGTWLATDLIHVFHPAGGVMRYTTQIELTRNERSDTSFSSVRALRDALSEVPAILRNDTWESSVLEAVYV